MINWISTTGQTYGDAGGPAAGGLPGACPRSCRPRPPRQPRMFATRTVPVRSPATRPATRTATTDHAAAAADHTTAAEHPARDERFRRLRRSGSPLPTVQAPGEWAAADDRSPTTPTSTETVRPRRRRSAGAAAYTSSQKSSLAMHLLPVLLVVGLIGLLAAPVLVLYGRGGSLTGRPARTRRRRSRRRSRSRSSPERPRSRRTTRPRARPDDRATGRPGGPAARPGRRRRPAGHPWLDVLGCRGDVVDERGADARDRPTSGRCGGGQPS